MFKTKFSEHNKIWEALKKIWAATSPECPPHVSAGLGRIVPRKSSIGGIHVCAAGIDILKVYI